VRSIAGRAHRAPGAGRRWRGDLVGVLDGGQLDEPDAVGELIEQIGGDLHGKAGLAGAAGAGEGEQMRGAQEALDLVHLLLPADEGGELDGEVIGEDFERAEGGEIRREIGSDNLEDALGAVEVAEAALAQIAQRYAVRKVVADQFLRGEGEKHLAAVGGGEQAADAVEDGAEVIAVAALRAAGVEAHADLDALDLLPRLVAQEALGGDRSLERRRRPPERPRKRRRRWS
jgi:hypothetical protein